MPGIERKMLKKNFLCVLMILREEFRKMGIPFNQDISFNEYNKPFFVDYPEFHFNILDSGNLVMLGFSKDPLGVDIEKIITFRKKKIMQLSK